jgi:hypothetical protein
MGGCQADSCDVEGGRGEENALAEEATMAESRRLRVGADGRPGMDRNCVWWLRGSGLRGAMGLRGPEAEVGEGLFYNRGLVKECNDQHRAARAGAQQGIGLTGEAGP